MANKKNTSLTNVNSHRIYYLDVLRTLACLSVILLHSSSKYAVKNWGAFDFWIGISFNSISRFCVIIFVMISGALLLDEKYKYTTQKIIKHIKKMIIFFVFWSAIYCIIYQIIEPILQNKSINYKKIIEVFFTGHYHLWFVYMIIGLYLIVPLLRLWVKDENKKQVEYFIILSIVFSYLIPQITLIGKYYSNIFNYINNIIEGELKLNYVTGYTTYFILGWYLHNYTVKHKKLLYLLGIFSLILSVFGSYKLSITKQSPILLFDDFSLIMLLYSSTVFLFIKEKYINSKSNKFINVISENSLGIYALHAFFVNKTYLIISKIGINIAIFNIPLVFLSSFLLSFLLSYILSKIPVLKKIV